MITKIKLLLNTIINIQNPWLYYKDVFKIFKKNEIYQLNLRNGLKIFLRANTPDRGIFNEIFFHKYYNPKNYEISENDTVIDIGAHIGVFSLYAGQYAKNVTVYSFEPNADNYQMLIKNINANHLSNIRPSNFAVNSTNKMEKMYLDNSNDSHGFYSKNNTHYTIVNCINLQKVIEKNKIKRINFLKMDCEGSEYKILYSLPEKTFKIIDKMVFEFHIKNSGHDPEKLIKFLSEKDFEVIKKGWIIYAKKRKKGSGI